VYSKNTFCLNLLNMLFFTSIEMKTIHSSCFTEECKEDAEVLNLMQP